MHFSATKRCDGTWIAFRTWAGVDGRWDQSARLDGAGCTAVQGAPRCWRRGR